MTRTKKSTPKCRPYQRMYEFMQRGRIGSSYYTIKAGPGAIEILKNVGNGVVEYVPLDEVADEVIKLCHLSKDMDLGPSDARPMAHWWSVINNDNHGLKEIPPPVVDAKYIGLAFRKLPWKYEQYDTLKKPMHFLEFCNRTSDPEVLQAYIGSLFVPNSYRQQYLYLFGAGNDGKGTLFNLLERMLGQTFTAEDVPEKIAPFWTSGLIGKRLCVFPDLEDPGFPVTPRFRKLTGDDLIRVEEKFKKSYSTRIFTKFIFASNDELQMTAKKADQRRALYIALDSYKGPTDTRYIDKLWAEAPAIYALCLEKYRKLCPKDGPILQSVKEPIHFERENEMDLFFNKYFEPDPKGKLRGAEWQRAKHDYFKRKPTAKEDRLLIDEAKARGYQKARDSKGNYILGLKKKSSLVIIHEQATLNP